MSEQAASSVLLLVGNSLHKVKFYNSREHLNRKGQQDSMVILEAILFSLLKCPSAEHWISSSSSGAGQHHLSAFDPLQIGQAWKISVHIHLFRPLVSTNSFAECLLFLLRNDHKPTNQLTAVCDLRKMTVCCSSLCLMMPFLLLMRFTNLNWHLLTVEGLTWAFNPTNWPFCLLLTLLSYLQHLLLLLHIQHLCSSHAAHPCSAFIADIADFNTLLSICVNLCFINVICSKYITWVGSLLFTFSELVFGSIHIAKKQTYW